MQSTNVVRRCDVECGGGRCGGGSAIRLGWPGEAGGERQEEVECGRGPGAGAVGDGTRRNLELVGEKWSAACADEGRWKGLRCKGATSGLAQDHIDRAAEAAGSQDRTPQDRLLAAGWTDLTEGWVAEDWCRASPAASRAARAPQMKKLRFKEFGGGGYGQCKAALAWETLDHCPQESGAGCTWRCAAREEEGGSVGHRRV